METRKAMKRFKIVNLRIKNYAKLTDNKRHILKGRKDVFIKVCQPWPNQQIVDIKNYFELQDVNGQELIFGKINNEYEIAVGAYAEIARGNPAEGSFIMPGGEELRFVKGYLKKIIQPIPVIAKITSQLKKQKVRHAYH